MSVAELMQTNTNPTPDAFLTNVADLNMQDAKVFGNLAVQYSLYVQKDLHVAGVLYAATLKVETIEAKKITTDQLCIKDVCIGYDELKTLLQNVPPTQAQAGNQAPPPDTASTDTSTSAPSPSPTTQQDSSSPTSDSQTIPDPTPVN
jgi:hypothetical protein